VIGGGTGRRTAGVWISPGGIPDRRGRGERYIRINRAKRSLFP
jgi:hypothetical protein